MFTKALRVFAAAAVLAGVAAPIGAQGFSDSYEFLKAVKEGDGAKVESLLATPGPLVNTKQRGTGDTAVHIVVRERDATWIRYLFGKGAKVDTANAQGETPLTIASQMGWLEGVQTLLDLRADVNLGNGRGETPLILAVQKRDLALVNLLMARGADPKKADRVSGQSALGYAQRDTRAAAILKALESKAPAAPKKAVAGPSL